MKCKNCGHNIYKTEVRWYHETINEYGEGDLSNYCQQPYCACRKPEPEKEAKTK